MNAIFRRVWSVVLGIAMLLVIGQACAADQQVRVGVLSFRSLEQTQQRWQPTIDYLNAHVNGVHFVMTPLYYTELDLAINRHDFDLVFTNPEHYVTIREDHGLSAIATLMPLANGHPVNVFGAVIFTRADRSDINSLQDVRGKVIASPAEQSLGGYLMQRWTLYKEGIGLKEMGPLHFTGMPHDNVVNEVMAGKAEVGFVRTGVLESMLKEGSLKEGQYKVLNLQAAEKYPQKLSTDLYPEWPVAAMPNVPDVLVKQVTLALLKIQPDDAAAKLGNYYGFSPTGNYSAIEAMMKRLKVNPEMAHEFNLRDVTRKYTLELMAVGSLLLLLAWTAALYLIRNNRKLQKSYAERRVLDKELQNVNLGLEEKVATRTHELQQSEARFRNMFENHASPMLLIDPDTGDIVNANEAAAIYYGYKVERMKEMRISDINIQSPDEIADERLQAQRQERNFFVFLHRLANGDVRTVEVHSSPIEVEGRALLFSIVHDITERKQLEGRMHDMAFYDPLTKLPNRRLLVDRLSMALASCARTQRHGALMFLDLDHFKTLNDLHGHDVGDQLLVEVSVRILSCVREQDSAARLGGDEFVVMLEGLAEDVLEAVNQAEAVAEKIRAALAMPYVLHQGDEEIVHHCSSSIGVAMFLESGETQEQLLKWADMAMYRAKDAGRNAIRFYDPDMQAAIEAHAAMEADLHTALEEQQFRLFYQVQVNAKGRAQGAEVLLRWQHPQRGLIPPLKFIPLAEETGLIVPIGAWVLDTACAQIKRWQNDRQFANLALSVNVSPRQFRQADFVAQVRAAVERNAIKPTSLKLELTESLVLDDVEDTISKMNELRDFGVSFSMDDFGTGYSSLSYLKRLPLDQIKIDQSFVRDITTDNADRVMVMIIVDLGMNFEVDVIAEGVETEEQFQVLHRYGCASFQGYLFGRPVPLDEFETMLLQSYPNIFKETIEHRGVDMNMPDDILQHELGSVI
ncbi:MAG: EAL domain-containing protein [Gallionella sp.]|nr:EAL domain-containing protein [Gallionella sp.]